MGSPASWLDWYKHLLSCSYGYCLLVPLEFMFAISWIFVGNKVEKLCDLCNITVNKNAVFGDSSALAPGGVRIGKKIFFS